MMAILYLFRDPNDKSHVLLVPVRTGWLEKVDAVIGDPGVQATCTCGTKMELYQERSGTTEYEPRCLNGLSEFVDNRRTS